MNYTRTQLESMQDLEGSTSNSKLKVSNDTTRVWLLKNVGKIVGTTYSVLIETKQGGKWLPTKRYPA